MKYRWLVISVLVIFFLFRLPDWRNPFRDLFDDLTDPDPVVRMIAKGKLVGAKDDTFPFLIKELESGNLETQMEIIQVLGFIGDSRAFYPLVKFLKHENYKVKIFTIDAIAQMKIKKAIPTLKSLIGDSDPKVEMWVYFNLAKRDDFYEVDMLKEALKEEKYSDGFRKSMKEWIPKVEARRTHQS